MPKKWKIILLVFFSAVVIMVALSAFFKMKTKKHSPADTITLNTNGLVLKTVYSRPYKKGRLVFGSKEDGALQPYGVYWRMGANEATTIEVNKDIIFAGKPLKAGKYSIYAVPGETNWKIGVNSTNNRWGYAEPDYSDDVLNASLPVAYDDNIVEQFTIEFEAVEGGANMVLRWDTSIVRIPID